MTTNTTNTNLLNRSNPRDLLQQMFAAAIEAAQPAHCIHRICPTQKKCPVAA